MPKTKVLTDGNLDIHVVEDENYKLSLHRGDGRNVSLYRVEVCSTRPSGIPYTVYVLAQDGNFACNQARCLKETVKTKATPIPFMVEGWGTALFE